MSITATFIVYSLVLILASLAGGWLPMVIRMTHRRMQLATSLIAGFMLGIALLHLLPHALMDISVSRAVGWMLTGLLVMFFLERFLSYHHHTAPGEAGKPPVTADPEMVDDCHDGAGPPIDHHHGHTHTHCHGTDHDHDHDSPAQLSWTGVAAGLIIHSLIGGLALGAAMMAQANGVDTGHDASRGWAFFPGVAVFLVILLHKPFDSMTLLTLLRTTGWSRTMQHGVNALFALTVPIGCALFGLGIMGTAHSEVHYDLWVGSAVAFAAGVFLCVSLADLLPEVHFHQHDRIALSVAVLIGLALSWGIAAFEIQSH